MEKKNLNRLTINQRTSLGILNLQIHPKEYALLKLYFSPQEKMMGLWNELWEEIDDYDLLPAGCRALMPFLVKKLQYLEPQQDWKHIHGLDLTFLSGLPRFVWTKNKFVLNQTLRISEFIGKSGIDIIAIKGTAELLSGIEEGMMRSTADIDLLIRPEDFELFQKKMSELGFYLIDDSHLDRLEKRSPLPKDQYVFKSNDKMMLEVDVHLMVNQYQADDLLTSLVWQGKVQTTQLKNLFVPSPRESFLIALVNAFRMHNWYAGSYLKYLCDTLRKFDFLYKEGLQNHINDYDSESLNLQDWITQIIQLGLYLSEFEEGLFNSFKLNPTASDAVPSFNSEQSIIIRSTKLFTKNMSAEKKKYILILLNLYSKAWKSRNKKGYLLKITLFLITDPFFQLFSLIQRRAEIILKGKNTKTSKKFLKTPISSINWN